jgi:HlyD family secretion protein
MKKKSIITLVGVLALTAVVVFFFVFFTTGSKKEFQFVKVSKGDVRLTVSCTGTLEFTDTEDVNALTSGVVNHIYADFNQKVKKGELLATLEDTLLRLAVKEAQAELDKDLILLEQAEKNYNDTKDLFALNYKSKDELDTALSNLTTAKAAAAAARLALDRAKVNLSYAYIVSPLTGIVSQRNIDVGQAASLSSPLFTVATSPEKMQILASVDENDISKVRLGMQVSFTVQSYQDNKFQGTVYQIRLVPTIVQNVVNYTVVVEVVNKENMLMPGMTATLDIIIDERKDVLRVPNSVLKFVPSEEMRREFLATREKSGIEARQAVNPDNRSDKGRQKDIQPARGTGQNQENTVMLWVLDESTGKVKPVRVKVGLQDGQWSEIESAELKPDMQVVNAIASSLPSAPSNSGSNPFQPPRGGFGGRH